MAKCPKIDAEYKKMFGGIDSPMFANEDSCEAAAEAIHDVEERNGTPIIILSQGSRLPLVRSTEDVWIRAYIIPLVYQTAKDFADGKIVLKETNEKIGELIVQRWSKIDPELRSQSFREIANIAARDDINPAISLILSRFAKALVSTDITTGLPEDERYFQMISSDDPYRKIAGINFLFTTIPGKNSSTYINKALEQVAGMIARDKPKGAVLAATLAFMGEAGQALPTKSEKSKVAEFIWQLIPDINDTEKALAIHALEALDHIDAALWDEKTATRLLALVNEHSSRENNALFQAITCYCNERFMLRYPENGHISSLVGNFIAIAVGDDGAMNWRAAAVIEKLLSQPNYPAKMKYAILLNAAKIAYTMKSKGITDIFAGKPSLAAQFRKTCIELLDNKELRDIVANFILYKLPFDKEEILAAANPPKNILKK